jgi:hypothetical protein
MAFRTGYRIPGRWALAVALAVVLIGITGVPGDAAGPWPYAVGGGAAMDPIVSLDPNALLNTDHFAFSALQGPSSCRGDFGSLGHGRFDLPEGDVAGPVSCVLVGGVPDGAQPNQAVFVVQNDKGSNQTITSLRVYVRDNGDLGPDQIAWETVPLPTPPFGLQCAVPFTASLLKTVVKGNIQVRYEPGGCPPSMQR